jgi:site-specific recombinase XerD
MSSVVEKNKQEFLEYLEIERGRAVKTVENYDRYLTRFFTHAKVTHPKHITEAKVREFRLWLNRQPVRAGGSIHDGETLKRRTQNYYLIAIRAFLKFLRKRGITSLSPERIELAKVPQRDLDLITRTELNRLLAAPMKAYQEGETENEKVRALRDNAILKLLFSTGLRVSELVSLDSDIDLSKDEMSIRGKGDKVRVVFFSPEAKKAVQKYLDNRKDLDEALFVNMGRNANERNELRLTSRSVERIVKHYATHAGITKKVTPHVVRHSFATDLLQNGADIRSVQALLGHANIATTQVYTHVTDKHLRDIHAKFHNKKK